MSFNFMAAVTICSDFGAQENKVCHCFHFSLSICHEMMGPDAILLVLQMLSFKPAFSLSSFTFIRRFFSSPSLSTIRVVSSAYLGIPDHLTCLLRNLYSGQEATVRKRHGNMDWFQIGKGEHQGCILSPCLFNLYAEHIMRNAGLEKVQAGIKIARRNINNLRYADDTALMA